MRYKNIYITVTAVLLILFGACRKSKSNSDDNPSGPSIGKYSEPDCRSQVKTDKNLIAPKFPEIEGKFSQGYPFINYGDTLFTFLFKNTATNDQVYIRISGNYKNKSQNYEIIPFNEFRSKKNTATVAIGPTFLTHYSVSGILHLKSLGDGLYEFGFCDAQFENNLKTDTSKVCFIQTLK